MNVYDFIALAKMYVREGWAVQEQLDDIIDGNIEDTNPNAVKALLPLLEELVKHGVDGAETELEIAQEYLNNQQQKDVREASWDVIALGEMQQPGGVGATMEHNHNPLVDGPNPEMDYGDNANNGFEQEVALKHWVDMAVDMLNRGEDEQLILAKLSHDGCPEPETVLQRAIEQPEEEPEAPATDEGLSAPMPAAAVPESETAMGLPQGVQAKVKVRGIEAKVLGQFTSQWGDETVRVEFLNGKVADVRPDDIEAVAKAVQEPVETVQQFIDSFPPVEEQKRSSIEDRIANIQTVRQRIAQMVVSHDINEQQRIALDSMDVHLHREVSERKAQLRYFATDADHEWVKEQPEFRINVVEQESMGHGHKSPYFLDDEVAEQHEDIANTNFDQMIGEDSAIMVSEMSSNNLGDMGHVHQMAASYINEKTAGLPDDDRVELSGKFVEAVFAEREKRLAQLKETPAIKQAADKTPDEDLGPDEALFL